MSVQRIDSRHSHGWQARAYLYARPRCRPVRLTQFFADRAHGGRANALRLARAAEARLLRRAARMRGL